MPGNKTLNDLLGFDSTKHPTPTSALFTEVATELQKERHDKAKGQAKELLTKAIELQSQQVGLEKKFNAEKQKFEKEFGKLMKQIEALVAGRDPEQEVPAPGHD